jgi:hypothetical protein
MLKDIPKPIVEDVAIAVVQEENELGEMIWSSYLINMKDEPIEGVLVSTKGYGTYQGTDVKTSMLRHFLDVVPGKDYILIEPIIENLFGLNNEFWLSFYFNGTMYDKKYIFLPESIQEDFFINIPFLNKKGVMIR